MSLPFLLTRRSLLAAAASAPLVMALRPARAASDIVVHAGANFTPINIAVTPFAGDEAKIGDVTTNDFAHSIFLSPLNATSFPEAVTNPDLRPNLDAWKTINAPVRGDWPRVFRRRQGHRAVPTVGHRQRHAGGRPAIYDRHRQCAPRRPSHRRRHLRPRHRRKGLLRLARRLRRRDRLEGEASQAAGGDGIWTAPTSNISPRATRWW